jgi:hypothetical protein
LCPAIFVWDCEQFVLAQNEHQRSSNAQQLEPAEIIFIDVGVDTGTDTYPPLSSPINGFNAS